MDKVLSIVNRLSFNLYVCNPPTSKWGGLLFLWKSELDLELLYSDANIIVMCWSIRVLPMLPVN